MDMATQQREEWENGADRLREIHNQEYMDASDTEMEHMDGLIEEHAVAKPKLNPKKLAQPTTIPFSRIQRTVMILQQRFRMR